MLTPAEADALIRQRLTCMPIESLPLVQCGGAVLRENIYAERDQPPFDRVTMDGIAIDSRALASGREFSIQGIQAAGEPPRQLAGSGNCLEVMTGAVLPQGCDCVVPVEALEIQDGRAHLLDDIQPQPWQNVHRRASDGRQGALLLRAGILLNAPRIAIIASAGMACARVSVQPSIMVVSTGNELVEPGEPIQPHQIRRSNTYGITAALRQRGFLRIGDEHLPDDPDIMRQTLRKHFRTHDVLILSGGVSKGRYDYVPRVLAELGLETVFHRISQRPGKPMWFGSGREGPAVFALPGNPVSALVCLARYVLPALHAAMGLESAPAEKVALAEPVQFNPPLTYFLPVSVEYDNWGRSWARPRPTHGSGDYAALADTDGFVELPPGPNSWPRGFIARLYRW